MDDNGPPAKKRGASRQLCKDDGSDSDQEPYEEGGSFRKASEEVLASRRIVKVRRPAAPPSAPSPNPFAAIRLVPPSVGTAAVSPAVLDVAKEDAVTKADKGDAAEKFDAEVDTADSAVSGSKETASPQVDGSDKLSEDDKTAEGHKEEENQGGSGAEGFREGVQREESEASKPSIPSEEAQCDAVDENGGGEPDNEATEQSKNEEDRSQEPLSEEQSDLAEAGNKKPVDKLADRRVDVQSPQASTKSLFVSSLGSVGTTFHASSFSFGTAPSTFGTPTGFASFRSSWTFGSASSSSSSSFSVLPAGEGGGLGSSTASNVSNGNGFQFFSSQQTGTVPPLAPAHAQPSTGTFALQEVPTETGEEQEKVVFAADASLFEFVNGVWKERGKGELKVNVSKDVDGRSRLLMRSKGNYRLLLNASLFPDMKMTSMDARGVTFVCVNSAGEDKNGMSTYAVKLKDGLLATSLREVVDTYKGKATLDLKTPENSPRAAHDSERDGDVVEP